MNRRDTASMMRWTLAFAALFLLSLDFWWWDGPVKVGPLHLPQWIYYFVILQLGLAVAVHFFGRRHWSEEPDDEPDDKAP